MWYFSLLLPVLSQVNDNLLPNPRKANSGLCMAFLLVTMIYSRYKVRIWTCLVIMRLQYTASWFHFCQVLYCYVKANFNQELLCYVSCIKFLLICIRFGFFPLSLGVWFKLLWEEKAGNINLSEMLNHKKLHHKTLKHCMENFASIWWNRRDHIVTTELTPAW